MERQIRNSVKALIMKDGNILVNKCQDRDTGEIYYSLPGGGQKPEELLTDTVKRECREELGIEIEPKSLVFIREGLNGEPYHRIDLVFLCKYIKEIENMVIEKDYNQIGNEWIKIDNLMNITLYPLIIREEIIKLNKNIPTEVYIGNEDRKN
ncbi:DNA mismatch repair protein MutT [Spirochaetia bacterium]|nr:DNA mismatch repair protein MutT [Spirochaetia bacterium]